MDYTGKKQLVSHKIFFCVGMRLVIYSYKKAYSYTKFC